MADEQPDLATRRALDHLDQMAEQWAAAVNADAMAAAIADKDDRETRFVALMKEAFVEGAYRVYCDAVDGEIPWLTPAGGPGYVLPCDVQVPPATTIKKGCKLSTLIAALERRAPGAPAA